MPQLCDPISLLFGCLQVRRLCTPTFPVSLFQRHDTCIPHHAIQSNPSLFNACYCFLLELIFASVTSYHTSHAGRIASCQSCAKPVPNVCQAAVFVSRADCWRSGPGVWHGQLQWGHKALGKRTERSKNRSKFQSGKKGQTGKTFTSLTQIRLQDSSSFLKLSRTVRTCDKRRNATKQIKQTDIKRRLEKECCKQIKCKWTVCWLIGMITKKC